MPIGNNMIQSNEMSSNLKIGIMIKILRFQILKDSHQWNVLHYSLILCTIFKIIGFNSKVSEICKKMEKEKDLLRKNETFPKEHQPNA